MNKMNFSKATDLLKEKKDKEAHKELAKYISAAKMTEEDLGHTYAEMASVYLKANNYLLKNYNGFLREVVRELRELNAKESTMLAD